jgi:hypothetical protein
LRCIIPGCRGATNTTMAFRAHLVTARPFVDDMVASLARCTSYIPIASAE